MRSCFAYTSRTGSLVLCLFLLACLGCGTSPAGNLHPVKGKVTFEDGKPLTKGSVILVADPTKNNSAKHEPMGKIGPDGSFEVYTLNQPGAPDGTYKVVVNAQADPPADNPYAIPVPLVNKKYQDREQTPLVAQVSSSPGPGAFDFKVAAPQ